MFVVVVIGMTIVWVMLLMLGLLLNLQLLSTLWHNVCGVFAWRKNFNFPTVVTASPSIGARGVALQGCNLRQFRG